MAIAPPLLAIAVLSESEEKVAVVPEPGLGSEPLNASALNVLGGVWLGDGDECEDEEAG